MVEYADKKQTSKSSDKKKSSKKSTVQKSTLKQPILRKENNTGLPDNLKSGVENLSGFSMDDVKVHYNSSKPNLLNAHAYAQGSDIHIAAGQEKHLPHETWHMVQQKQGRVQPTVEIGGMPVNDNPALEKEADVMGGKAAQFHSNDTTETQRVKKAGDGVAQRVVGILSSEADDFVVVASQTHAIAQSGGPVVEMDTGQDKFQGVKDGESLGLLYHGEDPNQTQRHKTQASEIIGYLQQQSLPAKNISLYLQSCMAGLDASGKVDTSMVSRVKSGLTKSHPNVLVAGYPGSIITPPADKDKVIVIEPQKNSQAGQVQMQILHSLGMLDKNGYPLSWSAMITKFKTKQDAEKKVNEFYSEFEKQINTQKLDQMNPTMTTM